MHRSLVVLLRHPADEPLWTAIHLCRVEPLDEDFGDGPSSKSRELAEVRKL